MRHKNLSINSFADSNRNQIVLFDLDMGGHHPSYIKHLIEYWCEQKISGSLSIVVSPKFVRDYADVALNNGKDSIRFVPITQDEEQDWKNQSNFVLKILKEWRLFCKYAQNLKASHALLMYFDHFQLPLALGFKSPCPFSGIYFRPTFHYKEFSNQTSSWKDSWRKWRQKMVLQIVLNNEQLKSLFSLDPFVVKHLARLSDRVKFLPLADPIQHLDVDQLKLQKFRDSLQIDSNRQVFLLFGMLDRRKGIYQLMDAIHFLSAEICQKICLLLVGPINSSDNIYIFQHIAELSQKLPIQIIVVNEYIPVEKVPLWFQISDFVLAPYQKHIGMSSVILHGAAAQKPILASDYGLIGKLTHEYQLGLTFDSTSPQAIANNIQQVFELPLDKIASSQGMTQLAKQNYRDRFAAQIFNTITNSNQLQEMKKFSQVI